MQPFPFLCYVHTEIRIIWSTLVQLVKHNYVIIHQSLCLCPSVMLQYNYHANNSTFITERLRFPPEGPIFNHSHSAENIKINAEVVCCSQVCHQKPREVKFKSAASAMRPICMEIAFLRQ
jgi:hypothetical protein